MVILTRKLGPYFEAHSIIVLITYPLYTVLYKPETSRRLVKWVIKLGEFNMLFIPRTTIKAQVLVKFMAEFTREGVNPKTLEDEGEWKLFTDVASNKKRSATSIVLQTPEGQQLEKAITFGFKAPTIKLSTRPYSSVCSCLRYTELHS